MANYPQRKKIVILGAGFAGIYALKSIYKHVKNWRDFDIVIIDKRNYFVFTPLLHEVATGGIDPGDAVDAIRDVIKGPTEHYEAKVLEVDFGRKIVDTSQGEVPYDYLVIALGAQTDYFDVSGADKYTFALKDIEDAKRLKNHLVHIFDQAVFEEDSERQRDLLRIVFIGGGATGVELAAEVHEFVGEIKKEYLRIPADAPEFYLIEAGDRLLTAFHPSFSEKVRKILEKRGFKIIFKDPCAQVTENSIICVSINAIKSQTVIWTPGVTPSAITMVPEPEKQGGGIIVEKTLNLKNFPEVFILGDYARFADERFGFLPATAQVAMEQGNFAGKNLARLIEGEALLPFRYFHKGDLVSVGKWKALADVGRQGGLRFSGPVAWLIWRFNYLFRMPRFSKKVRLFFDWILYCVSKRNIAEM